MATVYTLHPQNPQQRSIDEICLSLRRGAVMLYPTDTVYAIGCDLHSKSAIERVRKIKQSSNDKPLTFLCSSLSNIAQYAQVSDNAYRLMKRLIPGPYTFILNGTKLVPKLVMNPKRKTTGIRVPDSSICQALLKTLGNPIISTSAHLPDDQGEFPTLSLEQVQLFDALEERVDIIIQDGSDGGVQVSTILDLTQEPPVVVRKGLGCDACSHLFP
jgi:tRNA threonylcarbamoyl adenosine modification protein (Sua5/YciO/YrdC/YwlC family)